MQEHIFERMARERNISAEEMRAIISDRIEKGWNDKRSGQTGAMEKNSLCWRDTNTG